MASGAWKGIVNVLREKDEQEYTTKERQKDRDYRTLEKKEDRAYEQEMFMTKINEERRTALYSLLAERKAKDGVGASEEELRAQGWVMNNLGGVEGSEDLLVAAQADPAVALQIYGSVQEANQVRADKGFDPVPSSLIVQSFSAFGIHTTPTDILDYSELMGEIDRTTPGTPEYFDLMQRIGADPQGPVYGLNYSGDLRNVGKDELLGQQEDVFNRLIMAEVAKAKAAATDDPEAFDQIMEREKEGGPEAFYDLFGPRVASRLEGDSRFRNVDQNALLSPYFGTGESPSESVPEGFGVDPMQPQAEAEAPESVDTDMPNFSDPEVRRGVIDTAVVIPKKVNIEGQSLDVSDVQELSPDIVEEFAVPYEEWRAMSRTERKESGLPLSEIGGQIRYANRYGAYDFIPNGFNLLRGWATSGGPEDFANAVGVTDPATLYKRATTGLDHLRNFAAVVGDAAENPPPKEDIKGFDGPLKPYRDTNKVSAYDRLILDVELGFTKPGDRISLKGEVFEVTPEFVEEVLGKK